MSNTSRSAVCIMISLLLSAFASCGHQPRFASIMVTSTGIEPSPRLSSTVSQALDSLQAVAHSVAPSEDTRIDFSPSGKAAIATYRTRVGGFVWPDWRIAGPLALPENTKQAYFASDDYVWYTESDGTVTLASLARPREGIVLTTPCTLRQVFVVEAEEVLALTQDGRLLSASLGSGLCNHCT
jgi:hypothetical protein